MVEHLENQLRHVSDKTALRRSLLEKKEIAAKQFFQLTFSELRRIESEFWENYEKEQAEEIKLLQALESTHNVMDEQYSEIKPLFESLDEKITLSEFYDVIECKSAIWSITEEFKKNNAEFYDLVKNAEDVELVFDKIECKKKLNEYATKQLVVKRHMHELVELQGDAIYYYQPFTNTTRKVNI